MFIYIVIVAGGEIVYQICEKMARPALGVNVVQFNWSSFLVPVHFGQVYVWGAKVFTDLNNIAQKIPFYIKKVCFFWFSVSLYHCCFTLL